jgi:hypothetical protein
MTFITNEYEIQHNEKNLLTNEYVLTKYINLKLQLTYRYTNVYFFATSC